MDESVFALVAVIVFAVGRAIYTDHMSPKARLNRALARRPRARIGDAPDGIVRVTGRVGSRGDLLRAPVTGRPCVAFHLTVEVRGPRDWFVVVDVRHAGPFTVADGTGEALVDVSGPFSLALVPDGHGSTGLVDMARPRERQALLALVRSRGIPTETWFGTRKRFRFEEGVIEPGETVSVGGPGAHEPATDGERPSLRDPPERFVLRGTSAEPLSISDWPEAHGDRPV